MAENPFVGIKNRIFQLLARELPGAQSLRPLLHRWRGVSIGKDVWIGYDAIIETSYPKLVTIKDGASVGIRASIIAHFREVRGVVIEEDASIGPGAMVMPGVTIGRGAVVTAGSIVTKSVPALTVVQGNPAKPIARTTIPLKLGTSAKLFASQLRPL